jgi:hypothetical protein
LRTAPLQYIVMNPIIKFYTAVLAYLQSKFEDEGDVQKILQLASKASPSWEATEKSLGNLELCCNRGSTVKDENLESDTRAAFAVAAFKDLSVLRNPEAMELFRKIDQEVQCGMGDTYIWARKVNERPDGSAVIVLHVSDLADFRRMIEKEDLAVSGSLTETVIIGH